MLRRSAALAASSVFIVSILAFVASVRNERVWDDEKILGSRLRPQSATNVIDLWREPYWTDGPRDVFRPVGLSVLWMERRAFGESMTGFHVVSLVLHGLTSVALFLLLRRISPESVAWVAALVFAVHPAHAEAVAMAYGQLELLAALFAFLAMDRYLAAIRNDGVSVTALGLAFLAACSKESGLMLPAFVILLRGQYVKPEEPWRTRWFTWREALFLAPAMAYLALRRGALGALLPPAESTITYGYSAALRVKTVIVSLGNAIRLTIFPTGQTLYYGHLRDHLLNRPWPEMLWIGAGGVLCVALARETGRRTAAFAAAWFVAGLFPVLNIVPGGVLVAERNLYLPIAAAAFLAANLIWRLKWKRAVCAAAVAVCVVDGNLVARQWRSNESLWRSTVASYPTSPLAHAALGEELLKRTGSEGEAEREFERALELNPDVIGGHRGMAALAMRRGDYAGALRWLEEEQKIDDSEGLRAEINTCRLRTMLRFDYPDSKGTSK